VDGTAGKTLIRHNFRIDTWPSDIGVGKPAWSPDGTRIAFEHLGDGEFEPAQVFVMGSDGSNPRRPTSLTDGMRYAESDPSWSPDGSMIVYWSYGYGIAVVDSRGGVPNALYYAFPSVAYGAKPAWSPDGRTIVFNRDRHAAASAIWTMSTAGTGARVLIPGGYDAAWSPDGKRIAFVSAR
jgi:Tol biopolymer transport system component